MGLFTENDIHKQLLMEMELLKALEAPRYRDRTFEENRAIDATKGRIAGWNRMWRLWCARNSGRASYADIIEREKQEVEREASNGLQEGTSTATPVGRKINVDEE